MRTLIFIFLSLPFLLAQVGKITFSSSPSFELSYSISSDTLTMTLVASNSGYLAIGFGSLDMTNADCTYLAFSNGIGIVEDGYSTSEVKPTAYSTSHTKILSATRTGGVSTFKVERKLNPGLGKTYTIDPNSNVKMTWALGRSDTYDQHSNEGSVTVNFAKATSSSLGRMVFGLISILLMLFLY